ncbi:DUF3800 domain-containing protein [Pseudonocardia kunmingensis]|uniref:Uncharacterized protein DUF3800 n=1 Tax=Pseudonocardia kunmingensis TaxID=630975 RepID=A0A543CX75_9PSEU|nr:DUF3800 domain-containing protein [Pseudonocardia kunmingensis]TQM01716.1 uncharacterized protein DUF3800 [Pseudonocardia kunmingensis]
MAGLMSWSAYVDESEPDPRSGGSGVYVLAAARIEHADRDAARAALTGLRLRGQRKLHWHEESDQRRKDLVAAVAALPALHLVVVLVDAAASSERRRRKCLTRLLGELDRDGVAEVCLESREAKQNRRDRQLLDVLRSQRSLGPGLRMQHQPGPVEPLLWVPDIVAGSIGALRRGDPGYHDRLAGMLTVITI